MELSNTGRLEASNRIQERSSGSSGEDRRQRATRPRRDKSTAGEELLDKEELLDDEERDQHQLDDRA